MISPPRHISSPSTGNKTTTVHHHTHSDIHKPLKSSNLRFSENAVRAESSFEPSPTPLAKKHAVKSKKREDNSKGKEKVDLPKLIDISDDDSEETAGEMETEYDSYDNDGKVGNTMAAPEREHKVPAGATRTPNHRFSFNSIPEPSDSMSVSPRGDKSAGLASEARSPTPSREIYQPENPWGTLWRSHTYSQRDFPREKSQQHQPAPSRLDPMHPDYQAHRRQHHPSHQLLCRSASLATAVRWPPFSLPPPTPEEEKMIVCPFWATYGACAKERSGCRFQHYDVSPGIYQRLMCPFWLGVIEIAAAETQRTTVSSRMWRRSME
ncbi:hypothetical protein BJ170DRAFT_619235 [Xylariales sp. AK1849]|nr:hypothetical protein BJ170DRAFT_619235 [Xylariales sp. AK1849]